MTISTKSNHHKSQNTATQIGPQPHHNNERSVIKILGEIKWPKFLSAIKYTTYCIIASTAICAVLAGYQFCINAIISYLF